MELIDTHAHLFVKKFDADRDEVIERAIHNNVTRMFLPNIDEESVNAMLEISRRYPQHCYPMIGIHPTDIHSHYKDQLQKVQSWLNHENFYGIGETGIDLYWDKTYKKQQIEAFGEHIDIASNNNLPVIIHARNSYPEVFSVLRDFKNKDFTGIFHSFTGSIDLAMEAVDMGLKIGMGGIATFKNAGVDKVIAQIPPEHIVLETDSPYLSPTPKRGKRNESAYIYYINQKLAEIHDKTPEETAKITTHNAKVLFRIE